MFDSLLAWESLSGRCRMNRGSPSSARGPGSANTSHQTRHDTRCGPYFKPQRLHADKAYDRADLRKWLSGRRIGGRIAGSCPATADSTPATSAILATTWHFSDLLPPSAAISASSTSPRRHVLTSDTGVALESMTPLRNVLVAWQWSRRFPPPTRTRQLPWSWKWGPTGSYVLTVVVPKLAIQRADPVTCSVHRQPYCLGRLHFSTRTRNPGGTARPEFQSPARNSVQPLTMAELSVPAHSSAR
ncbi:hypothetical protein M2283_001361 [Streptomyces pseudovenezuelae]|uniref:Transposase DDE domain-containing protein n=1 Tax=Streptomyces pseudovenezuelae TaxID=67350 RepID=A0ABT6LCR9_9ACTN|nr:hypothetical protein [Streptomyces pseudovenezuelae]